MLSELSLGLTSATHFRHRKPIVGRHLAFAYGWSRWQGKKLILTRHNSPPVFAFFVLSGIVWLLPGYPIVWPWKSCIQCSHVIAGLWRSHAREKQIGRPNLCSSVDSFLIRCSLVLCIVSLIDSAATIAMKLLLFSSIIHCPYCNRRQRKKQLEECSRRQSLWDEWRPKRCPGLGRRLRITVLRFSALLCVPSDRKIGPYVTKLGFCNLNSQSCS